MFGTLISIGLGLFGYGSLVMDSVKVDESKERQLVKACRIIGGLTIKCTQL